jgi:hypothetical protein
VYQYDETRNGLISSEEPWGLPPDHEWTFLLGLDLGFEDSTAIVVAAWSETYDKLIEVYCEKHAHMTIPEVAAEVNKAIRVFDNDIDIMIADTGGLGKMIIETLSEQYGLHFERANKKEKPDHIELLNSDLVNGKVLLLPNGHTAREMKVLQWVDNKKKKENPFLENHACDAFLYLWRYARHHYMVLKSATPVKHTREWELYQEKLSLERLGRKSLQDGATFAEEFFDNTPHEELWI